MDCYYVPLEQIRENIDLSDEAAIIGWTPTGEYTLNRVKRYDEYDLYLIVEYKTGDNYAREIRTGEQIRVLNIINPINEDGQYEKSIVNTSDIHTYIRNPIILNKSKKELKSLTFTDENNLMKMDPDEAKEILEMYDCKFTKVKLAWTLKALKEQGEERLRLARERLQEKEEKEAEDREAVRTLLNKFKSHS